MLSLSFRRTSPLSAACVLLLALSGCHDGQGGAPSAPLPEVGVATVVPRTVRIADEFNGRVEAVDAVELRPRVSGYLQRIRYKEGDLVAQGAVLFEIDPRPYRIALDRAIAQQQRARAAEHLARVQLQRVQTLIDAHATSQEELDNARTAAEQARADLQAADAAVADAKLNLGFTEVRAPISGRVGRALATAGNLARADDTLLTTVVSQDPVYVYFDCDEQSYLRYNAQRADPAHRAIGADPVRVGLANEMGFPHAGTVDFLDNRLDPQTGTIRARVRLPNADHTFTPGLYARVQLVSGRERSALLVDDKAVLTDQDRKYVYVIGPGDKALRRDVTIGRDLDGQRIVEKGLNAGDRVVVDGVQRIYYPGAQVKPKPQPARADAEPGGGAQAVADAGGPAAQ
ncbi:efflux RND transporter periplasmic adaptor subunit [Burkholderia multivorans]|uniref:efflux RND transporter periplasmic adaptor subunit n=1 Tax=Burkholderia multivorans TaxID=87883 RepID=UPI000277CC1B|nr:efflux RND transporter periplasmic adaptor subunit [Burkholderia multivorans]AVR18896.1 MexE family multidrug efflux RND transporter periplasmic adaptor subunit [Burkholderia multivorans]EJO60376.1 efflux transporter, RND family, MFP subunit [Burkholderia multivorans ATCC BAA-247]MBU9493670.1 efflux RND transporter periplasmic adaptor subunit [Burkholderia multivorans]MCO1438356.1 efflux RND transporter periplasmic adaptor subunit [Burkholderia multivorans]MDN7508594.1 efflux RND transporte